MVKKTVTYEDFDGNERTEDFYFNLTKAELVDLEVSIGGGFKNKLEQIIKEKNQAEIIKYFKEIVLMSYGHKSLDGRTFIKNDEIRNEFTSTMAYSNIFMELASDDKAAADFVNGIIPKDLTSDHKKPELVQK